MFFKAKRVKLGFGDYVIKPHRLELVIASWNTNTCHELLSFVLEHTNATVEFGPATILGQRYRHERYITFYGHKICITSIEEYLQSMDEDYKREEKEHKKESALRTWKG